MANFLTPSTMETRNMYKTRIEKIHEKGIINGIDNFGNNITIIDEIHHFFPLWGSDYLEVAQYNSDTDYMIAAYCSTCGEKDCNPASQMCKGCLQGRKPIKEWYYATDAETLYYKDIHWIDDAMISTPYFTKWEPEF